MFIMQLCLLSEPVLCLNFKFSTFSSWAAAAFSHSPNLYFFTNTAVIASNGDSLHTLSGLRSRSVCLCVFTNLVRL